MDSPPDNFYTYLEISFMESPGLNGSIIHQYWIYHRIDREPEYGSVPLDLDHWLINDVSEDKWYRFAIDDAISSLDELKDDDSWVEILNDVW